VRRRILAAAAALTLLVVGTVVLVAWVNGADRRALAGVQTVSVLVVDQAIPAGTSADQVGAFVTTQLLPAKAAVPGHVEDLTKLKGQVTTVALEPGEQLLTSRFADPADAARGSVEVPKGMQEVSVQLDPQRAVGGQLKAGDTVGVLVSLKFEGGVSTTHMVLHKVLVTKVVGGTLVTDTPTENGAQGASSTGQTGDSQVMVTLAVNAPDVETVVFGAEHGTVWLTHEPDTAGTDGTKVVTQVNEYGDAVLPEVAK
jgi:pilus assembly protein CpaB